MRSSIGFWREVEQAAFQSPQGGAGAGRRGNLRIRAGFSASGILQRQAQDFPEPEATLPRAPGLAPGLLLEILK
jgi:hypothetical protein